MRGSPPYCDRTKVIIIDENHMILCNHKENLANVRVHVHMYVHVSGKGYKI